MRRKTFNELQKIPLAPLGIISMDGSQELGNIVDRYLVEWRKEYCEENGNSLTFPGYNKDTFLVKSNCYRFSSGEGKGVIQESIRGYDLFIIADVGNYSIKYNMHGIENHMSPDDHFQDLKRIISAAGGKARRINIIMPLLYESRQHKRLSRESLDCALALKELEDLGVDNIITFDAHDPKVQNAIPLTGFENIYPTYQIIKALLNTEEGIKINKDNMMMISPDEGGVGRNLYYSNLLGIDLGMFYKRRDFSRIVNGRNPIVKHEFLGDSVEGKDVLIVDDMISSGESILEVAKELKERKARKIFVAVTFGLFTEGFEKYDKYYNEGIINRVFCTNLTYRKEQLKSAPWYVEVDMSKFIAHLINTLNHDQSLSSLLDPKEKIKALIKRKGVL